MTAKKKTTETVEETVVAPAEETASAAPSTEPNTEPSLEDALVVVPAKICVQIGQRKRYFDTREEALAALKEFTERHNKPKGPARTFKTAEQKAAEAARREILLAYAIKQGKEGKNAAALANVLEDICDNIPALIGLIEAYNAETPDAPPEQVEADTTTTTEAPVQEAPAVTEAAVDPLAEFGM